MKIAFLVYSLQTGGAQRQLVLLAKGLQQRGHQVSVLTYYFGGAFEPEILAAGIELVSLHKDGRYDIAGFLSRLVMHLRRIRPDVVHSYLGSPNVLSVLIRPLLPATRVVWGVRASNMDLARYDWLWRLSHRLECRLSRFADMIIANSQSGLVYSVQEGFPQGSMVEIPNGIDVDVFCPDQSGRENIRAEWNIAGGQTLVGMVARLDPMKDHVNFIEAAARVARVRPNCRFVCVGDGQADYRGELEGLAQRLGLEGVMRWTGARSDMPAVYNALDIAVSASAFGEGFPNTVGEAMACGVPCVVTDVGDSARVVGNSGCVVSPANPDAMAEAVLRLIDSPSAADAHLIRSRIAENFGVDRLVSATESRLTGVLDARL